MYVSVVPYPFITKLLQIKAYKIREKSIDIIFEIFGQIIYGENKF